MKKQYKIDLHTHSIISHDGGLKKKHYGNLLKNGILDCIAITDHNETSFARSLNSEFGDKIIVGEEITTIDGEIIGLFLNKTIPKGLSAQETAFLIHEQGGLVYVPHPFETFRAGIRLNILDAIIKDIDIIEVFNARGYLRGKSLDAHEFSTRSDIVMSASSDAHCKTGIGSAYSIVEHLPNKNSLVKLLKSVNLVEEYAKWYSYFCPSFNKIKNKLVLGV